MQNSTPSILAFAVGLILMMISLAANIIPTLRSQSIQVRTQALIRAGIINAFIIAGVIFYVVHYQHT